MAFPADGNRVITLFGGVDIRIGPTSIGGRATHRHPLAILAFLVANGGRGVSRDKLMALLWPERDVDSARNLLKVNIHELRKALGDAAIRSTGDQLSADLGELSCDVRDFLAALEQGDDARAAELYAGPFLDGFFIKDSPEFEQWVDRERSRFATSYGEALERLGAAAEARADYGAALKWRRAHAAHDPYNPGIAYQVVRTLAASGDRAGAIQFAEAFSDRQRRDFEISEDHEIVALARQLERGQTPAYVPPIAVAPAAYALPAALPADLPASQPPAPVAGRRAPRVSALIMGIGAAAMCVAGAAVFVARGVHGTVATRPAVAVMPFSRFGTDTSLGNGLIGLLAARFSGEGSAPALDPVVVSRSWNDLAAAAHGPPALDAVMSASTSLGATQLLTGEIVSTRDSIAVVGRLYDLRTKALVATSRVDASTATSPEAIADRMAIDLIARGAGEPDDRVADLEHRPLVATRKYVAGEIAYRSARYAAAESLYAEALQLDTTFGAAGLGLALANSWTGINDHYGKARDAAVKQQKGMSARDRAFIAAFFGPDPALGPPRSAPVYLTAWEDVTEKWPDWSEAFYQLGDRYYHFGGLSGLGDPSERARTAFRRALALDTLSVAPLHHLVELYAARGETADLRATAERYFAVTPSVSRDRSAIGWEAAMGLGDSAWVRRIRANLEQLPREDLARIGWVTDLNGWPRADAERAATILDRRAAATSEHEKALILLYTLSLNGGQLAKARAAAAGLGAIFPGQPVDALYDMYAALFGDGNGDTLALDAGKRLAPFVARPAAGDHVQRDQHDLAACMYGYWKSGQGDLASARTAQARVQTDLKAEDNGFALRNAHVCQAMLAAAIAVRANASDARVRVAQLDTVLLRERVPPHLILEAGTIAAARMHAALGDTAAALIAARRREHLTGEPTFLSTELGLEAQYAAAMGDTVGARRAAAHLQALRPAPAR